MRPAMACRVAQPSTTYEPRCPAQHVLHQIVLEHVATFRAQAAGLRDGEGLPRFVEQEFRDSLRCGRLAGGFARFRCTACGLDRLVAFSWQRPRVLSELWRAPHGETRRPPGR